MAINATGYYRGNKNLWRNGSGDAGWSYIDASGIGQAVGLTGVVPGGTLSTNIWDSFMLEGSSTAVFSPACSTTNFPTLAQAGHTPTSSFQLTTTTVSTMGAGELVYLAGVIDSLDAMQLDSFTLSFWVYATVTGTYCIRFGWGATSQKYYIHEYTVTNSNTAQKITVTLTPPSFITTPSDATCGLKIDWILLGGTNAQGTAGAWTNYNTTTYCTANQVNAAATNGNIFAITSIQLERGKVATSFELESRTENRLKLLPWCEAVVNLGGTWMGAQIGASTVQAVAQIAPKIATGGTVYTWNITAANTGLGQLTWRSTTGTNTARNTTSTATKNAVIFEQTAALDLIAQGSFCVDARNALFNF